MKRPKEPMDANALNLALAKWDGWTCRNCGKGPDDCTGCDFDDYPDYVLPNYTSSLNAVATLRKKLNSAQRDMFILNLSRACGVYDKWDNWSTDEDFILIDATAFQHCEAIARAIGVWQD